MTKEELLEGSAAGLLTAIAIALCADPTVKGHAILGELTPTDIALFVAAEVAREKLESHDDEDDECVGGYLSSVCAGSLVTKVTKDLDAGKEAMSFLFDRMQAAMEAIDAELDALDSGGADDIPELSLPPGVFVHDAPTTKQ